MKNKMTKEEALIKVKGYLNDYLALDCADEIDEIIEALEQTRWIPVSERLPEEGQRVLVTDKLEAVTTAMYFTKSPFWREMAVAWMPLPQPYKAESKTEQALAYADQDTLMSAT